MDILDPPCLDAAEELSTAALANDQWSIVVLLAADFVAAIAAVPVALILLSIGSPVSSNSLSNFWRNAAQDSLFPVAIVIALALGGFYRSNRRAPYESSFSELKELAIALCAGCVISIGLSVALHSTFDVNESNATQLFLATIVVMGLIAGAHTTLGAFSRGARSRVIIVGSDPLVDRIATYVSLTKGVEVVGRVVDAPTPDEGALGTVSDLPQLCEKYPANRIIVAFPTTMSHDSVTVLRSLPASVHITIVPRYFELVSWRSRMTDLYGLPLIEVAPAQFSRWDRSLKRGFDIVASSLLLLLFSPLALILSVLVKFSSPGPVLFRQQRLGRGRQVFTIYKFRTMVPRDPTEIDESESSPYPVLRFRSTSCGGRRRKLLASPRSAASCAGPGLDEIPQILNVLLGNMSLVGPRPFTESESETLVGWEARRFDLRPGMTGLWQVCGRNDLCIDDLRRLDYLYVASWSLWWDVKIVWETPTAMAAGVRCVLIIAPDRGVGAIVHDYLTQRGGAERSYCSWPRHFRTRASTRPSTILPARSRSSPASISGQHRSTGSRSCAASIVWPSPSLRHHSRLCELTRMCCSVVRVDGPTEPGLTVERWSTAMHRRGGCIRPSVTWASPVTLGPRSRRKLPGPDDAQRGTCQAIPLRALSRPLRHWDRHAANTAHRYLANSTVVSQAIRGTYGLEAEVLYPPPSLAPEGPERHVEDLEPGYLLCIARLLPYKNVQVVAQAVRAHPRRPTGDRG